MCCISPNQSLPVIQPVLITHKVMETIALSFHVVEGIFKRCVNEATYHFFEEIHESSHKVEPLLHFICFMGDIASIVKRDYWRGVGRIELIGKVCHSVAHLLSSLATLVNDFKIEQVGRMNLRRLRPLFDYQIYLSITGYGFLTLSLIREKIQSSRKGIGGPVHDHFAERLGVYLGGFVSETLFLARRWSVFTNYRHPIGQLASVAGLVHCICSIRLIMNNMKHSHDHEILEEGWSRIT